MIKENNNSLVLLYKTKKYVIKFDENLNKFKNYNKI